MKATIKLTPRIHEKIKDEEGAFAFNKIILDEKGLTYKIETSYTDHVVKTMENIETDRRSFLSKKSEHGRIRRDLLMSVTRSSSTILDDEKLEKEESDFYDYEHMIILETSTVPIGLTCTHEELKKYFPIVEDYYMGGDKWKQLAIEQQINESK